MNKKAETPSYFAKVIVQYGGKEYQSGDAIVGLPDGEIPALLAAGIIREGKNTSCEYQAVKPPTEAASDV